MRSYPNVYTPRDESWTFYDPRQRTWSVRNTFTFFQIYFEFSVWYQLFEIEYVLERLINVNAGGEVNRTYYSTCH